MFYTLSVIISSNMFGASWGPDVGGFICQGTVHLGCWKSAEGESGKSPWGQDWGCFPVGGPFQPWSQLLPPRESRYLRQETEVSVQNGTVGAMEEFQEAVCHEVECIGLGQRRKEFLLLRLVVQDFCLWVTEGKKSRRFATCHIHLPISPMP